jgi:hypothetical protein
MNEDFSGEALEIFRELRELLRTPITCTCVHPPSSTEYWVSDDDKKCAAHIKEDELTGKLFRAWPGAKGQACFVPIIATANEKCPLPIQHRDRPQWFKDHAAAVARWKQIEAAADEAEAKR